MSTAETIDALTALAAPGLVWTDVDTDVVNAIVAHAMATTENGRWAGEYYVVRKFGKQFRAYRGRSRDCDVSSPIAVYTRLFKNVQRAKLACERHKVTGKWH